MEDIFVLHWDGIININRLTEMLQRKEKNNPEPIELLGTIPLNPPYQRGTLRIVCSFIRRREFFRRVGIAHHSIYRCNQKQYQ